MDQKYFCLFSPLSVANKHAHFIWNRHKKTLKGREKKIVEKGTLGPEEWYDAEFTGFYFYLLCMRHGSEKGGNREVQMSIGKWKTRKKSPFSCQRTSKGAALQDRKLPDHNWITTRVQPVTKIKLWDILSCLTEEPE